MATLSPSKTEFFVNPYNFVRQSMPVDRSETNYDDLVSGVISCRLIVKDKLAMPDHENHNEKNTKGEKYDFYQVNGLPLVPGSEIRGCIRSIFETLTGSCYSVVNSDILTKRDIVYWNDIAKPCIAQFENGNWYIYPARKLAKEERRFSDNDSIKRKWKTSPKIKKQKFLTQYYTITDAENGMRVPEKKMDGFSEIIEVYLKNNENDNEFSDCIKELKNNFEHKMPFVAFYKIDSENRITYLSPVQLGGRKAFDNTVNDLLNIYKPCSDNNNCCPACRLFGMVGKNKPKASGIRFSDAVPYKNVQIDNYVMLPPLSSPKTTSVEFYSTNGTKLTNVPQWDYDSPEVALRGRKFYFHSKPKKADNEQKLVTGQFATRCALAGSEFAFKIYFDKISEKEQLSKLLWCLTFGENSVASNLMQKIGAGKPVGYGSVKILIDKIDSREVQNGSYRIVSKKYEDIVADARVFDAEALAMMKKIADYDFVRNENVSYPIADDCKGGENSKAAHQWFSANRPVNSSIYQFVLPSICKYADDLRLPAMYPPEKTGNGKSDKNNTADSIGVHICPVCGKNECKINAITGKYYQTCHVCGGKAPICPVCGKKKCSFNPNSGKYYRTCFECSKQKR